MRTVEVIEAECLEKNLMLEMKYSGGWYEVTITDDISDEIGFAESHSKKEAYEDAYSEILHNLSRV